MKLPDLVHWVFAAVLLALSTPAHAQMSAMAMPDAKPACTSTDKDIPAPWSGWASPEALKGGSGLETAGKLAVGRIYSAVLPASPGMSYVVPLHKPAAGNTFAGLFTLIVDKAGTYSVALSEGAWIDMAPAAGAVLSSTAHGHGPACTTIQKVVDFTLQPGAYVIQISAAPASPIVIAIEPKS